MLSTPIPLYRCKTTVCVNVATARTVSKLTDGITNSGGGFSFLMWVGFIIAGVTTRAVRFISIPGNHFAITLVASVASHSARMRDIKSRLVTVG